MPALMLKKEAPWPHRGLDRTRTLVLGLPLEEEREISAERAFGRKRMGPLVPPPAANPHSGCLV